MLLLCCYCIIKGVSDVIVFIIFHMQGDGNVRFLTFRLDFNADERHAGAAYASAPASAPAVPPPNANPAFVWDQQGHKQASFDGGHTGSMGGHRGGTPNSLADDIDIGVISSQRDSRAEHASETRAGVDAAAGKRPRSSASNASDADSTAPPVAVARTAGARGAARPSVGSSAAGAVVKKKPAVTASSIYK
jgi:hypothetical protein